MVGRFTARRVCGLQGKDRELVEKPVQPAQYYLVGRLATPLTARNYSSADESNFRRLQGMEKEQVTGKVDELKGKAKQAIGNATGNPNLQDEGVFDEGKGRVKQAYGDVKDTIKGADREAGTDINDK